MVSELAGCLDLHGHVGEHELNTLEFGHRVAELLALLHIADGVVERALGDAECLGGDGDPGVVEASTSAAAGAILASARSRTVWRSSSCSSDGA
jgi:hypothetical protein